MLNWNGYGSHVSDLYEKRRIHIGLLTKIGMGTGSHIFTSSTKSVFALYNRKYNTTILQDALSMLRVFYFILFFIELHVFLHYV